MKWAGLCTVYEPSYPQLVKAFYTCLQSEDEATLVSSVKGEPPDGAKGCTVGHRCLRQPPCTIHWWQTVLLVAVVPSLTMQTGDSG
ncbi:hypothetical protein Taro_024701 [Colocasia esculenta]|uniref:Uncharacterized protein n=1 Tax=Colocasia esculenta TaxID=4460 RepID=A0A843V6Z9_COLES|nr:hypothetical protein [Colocasia esculenta]